MGFKSYALIAAASSLCAVLFVGTFQGGYAQEKAKLSIQFSQPAAFRCGATIMWKDLKDWTGQWNTSICGNEHYYTIKGKVKGNPKAYKIKAEIYVPEAQKAWPTSGGAFRQIDKATGSFTGDFCIPKKEPEREFRFQVYALDKTPVGEACIIKVDAEW